MKKRTMIWTLTALLITLAGTAAAQECVGNGYNEDKNVYFGDLHTHTSFSFDAVTLGTDATPTDAYNFARNGASIDLATFDYDPGTRSKTLARPLDFLSVTDHSEYFGEVRLCLPCGPDNVPAYDEAPPNGCTEPFPGSKDCDALQESVDLVGTQFDNSAFANWALNVAAEDPVRFDFCDPAADCIASMTSVWQEVQDAANTANTPCEFTTFIGYEWTSQPNNLNYHRNVIFKNADVPSIAFSIFETGGGGYDIPNDGAPQLWRLLEDHCTNPQVWKATRSTGERAWDCDALAIPHNANVGGGTILPILTDPEHQNRQIRFERLMEIHQAKGNSECRMNVGTTDEDCQFELMSKLYLFESAATPERARGPVDYTNGGYLSATDQGYAAEPATGGTYNTFQREILKGGLYLAQDGTYPENPYKLGTVGGTDTHSALAGDTAEEGWEGHHNIEEATPNLRLSTDTDGFNPAPETRHQFLEMNPGALTAIWAPENTRDALFTSMKNRETYATSGNRPKVRFFAAPDTLLFDPLIMCNEESTFAQLGYDLGVPMGSDLVVSDGFQPAFAVWASKDPALPSGLQRLQIVKGWIENGLPKEKVWTIASDGGDPTVPETYVDPTTCTIKNAGKSSLCTIWEDPEFDAAQDAFYYVRLLETPTCRWSTLQCNALTGDDRTACEAELNTPGATSSDDSFNYDEAKGVTVQRLIQERAWTSPIWYESSGSKKTGQTKAGQTKAGQKKTAPSKTAPAEKASKQEQTSRPTEAGR